MALVVGLLLVVLAAAVVWWVTARQERLLRLEALDLAETYTTSWNAANWDRIDTLVGNRSAGAGEAHRRTAEGLDATEAHHEVVVVDFDDPGRGDAVVHVESSYELPGLGSWTTTSQLVLARLDERWVVDWSPAAIHPELGAGQHLARTRTWPERAPILGRDGEPLSGSGELVVVGIEPQRVNDRDEVVTAVTEHTDGTASDVHRILDRPDLREDWFYTVTALPRDRYEQVRDELHPVPGLVFRAEEGRTSAAPELVPLVGSLGEITAEQLSELGDPYRAGDLVGQSGLERTLERELAGSPGGDVRIVDEAGEAVEFLHDVPPDEPAPVTLTVDPAVQRAAAQALGDQGNPAALVAVDVASGEVRASVNRPSTGFDRALSGQYPPGSTFKVVTAAAALASGASPSDSLECPGEARVGGRGFRNAGNVTLGTLSLAEAFAESCNTAFVRLAMDLPEGALAEAAEQFGFGLPYELGIPGTGGSFPLPEDSVEVAAAAIGQARVTATPLHMAGVAGTVARGAWITPTVIVPDDTPERVELPAEVGEHLPALMRRVVTAGTGENASLPDRPVYGKTGTAEYGTDSPPATHGWFIGFSGDVAFAVLVEDASSGGGVAAPIAADFLRRLQD